ncbi:putative arabinose efflux permease, MFS family [Dehalogenimonas formicexedens]|uniref:Putative arabinose efflux permease, MFS family n=1 Tax=Dehalogenimonas formicexedens TaxID=1839801 RepID=A0A1P8F874_9CHLR|nr:MFS transporter [Dehalogenimonas formicexedens]APV44648.1 putative arabinose efflux permease, MFS family [Dehalogenimonas formicexedens]
MAGENPAGTSSSGLFKLTENSGRWLLATTTIASGMTFLVGSAIGVALPVIQSYFNAPLSGIQWVASAYLVSLSALILIGGALGDHFGRKRIFNVGVIIFFVGEALSSASPDIGFLIAFQGLAGIGSALMVPQSLAIINASFVSSERGRVIGLWAGLSGAVSAGAPWIGGLLTQISWRAVFFIPLPLCFLILWLSRRYIPENPTRAERPPNWWLSISIFAGLAAITFALIEAPVWGFTDPPIIAAMVAGAMLLVLFAVLDRRFARPILPPSLFKSPLVTGANLATLLLYFSLNGTIYFTVLNLQQVQGFSPSTAGLSLLPSVLIIMLLSGAFGSLADRIGPRTQMIAGPLVVASGIGLLALSGVRANYWITFFPGLVLIGLGMSAVIAPLTKSALSVNETASGAASGLNNAVARIAALLAVALLGAVMATVFSTRLEQAIDNTSLSSSQRQEILDQSEKVGAVVIPADFGNEARMSAESAVKSSFVYSFRWVMGTAGVLAVGAAGVSFVTIHNPRGQGEPPEYRGRKKT